MNETTARAKGLVFTGMYTRYDVNRFQGYVDAIRKLGYKAYLVTVPDSPLSRGYVKGSRGYAVYSEQRYMNDKQAEKMRSEIAKVPSLLEECKKEYETKVAALNGEKESRIKWLKDHGYSA